VYTVVIDAKAYVAATTIVDIVVAETTTLITITTNSISVCIH
jgi:hypothetical protein